MSRSVERLIRRNDYSVFGAEMAGSPTPVVSVLVQAFNQKKYIQECLASILTQKTDFPFEVIVGDDCSGDGTVEALRDLSKDAANLNVRSFRNNLGRRLGNGRINFYRNLMLARGEFVAMVSGDDYWVGDDKLASQVDRLRSDAGIAGVFCNVLVDEPGRSGRKLYSSGEREVPQLEIPPSRFGRAELLQRKWIHMSGFMFRACAIPLFRRPEFFRFRWGDTYIPLAVSMFGEIEFRDETMSAYRFYGEGVWSGMSEANRSVCHLIDVYLRAVHFGQSEEDRRRGLLALRRLIEKHGFSFWDFLKVLTRPSQFFDFKTALNMPPHSPRWKK